MRCKTTPPPPPAQTPLVGIECNEQDEDRAARKRVYLITFPHPRAAVSVDGYTLKAPGQMNRQQLLDAFRDSCAHPHYVDLKSRKQGASVTLNRVLVVFELHQQDELARAFRHGHIGALAENGFRFLPVKRALLMRYGLASHWSCTHDGYHSVVSYLQWPSEKKKESSLDREALWWARAGPHPPLEECRHEPNTAAATKKKREFKEKRAAEEGQEAPRITELDVYALVVEKGFRNTEDDRTMFTELTQTICV